MLEQLKKLLKEVYNKLFSKKQIENKLNVSVNISDTMADAIKLWSNIYTDNTPWKTCDIKPTSVASGVAREVATLVTLEMQSEIEGPDKEFIDNVYQNVLKDIRIQTEYAAAKGGIVFRPYYNGETIAVDYVHANNFYPVRFAPDGTVIECLFVETIRRSSTEYLKKVEHHNFLKGQETITNYAFKSNGTEDLGTAIPIDSVPEWQGIEREVTITNLKKPTFAYFKMPFANTIDPTSPLGVSIYSRTIPLLEEADKIYYNLTWEMESGKRSLYTDSTAFKKDENGNEMLPDRRLYKTLDTDDDLFEEWSPGFRNADITIAMNDVLRKIEFNCGLAYGTVSDPQSVDKTATEVKQSKQRSFATVSDIQKSLKAALEHTVYSISALGVLYGLCRSTENTVTFEFDDSIVVDRETQLSELVMLKNMGVISEARLLAWYDGISLEEAEKLVPEKPVLGFEE